MRYVDTTVWRRLMILTAVNDKTLRGRPPTAAMLDREQMTLLGVACLAIL
jgi:hypothetical protein